MPLVDGSHNISLGAGCFFNGAIISPAGSADYAFKASVKEIGDRDL